MQTEEFEQIPWSQLLPPADDGRRRTLYIVAGILVALVAGVIAARSIGGPPPTVVDLSESAGTGVAAPPAAATPPDVAQQPDVADSTAAPFAPGVVSDPLSEADLMAVLPEEEARAAAAAAEWFVTDYFTVDGGAGSRERVVAAVPDLAADVLPHERSDGLSYVEWARSVRIEPAGPRSYDVTVWYGSVASHGSGSIMRLPVKVVAVSVRFADSGAPEIVGLPRPQATEVLAQSGVSAEPAPESVVAAALGEALMVGDEPEAMGAYRAAGGWHVVVLVQDPISGMSWPLAIEVDE